MLSRKIRIAQSNVSIQFISFHSIPFDSLYDMLRADQT